MSKRRVPPKLSSARAYWRLAAKASKNGEWAAADHYTDIANRCHRDYLRQKEYTEKLKQPPRMTLTPITEKKGTTP